MRTIEEIANPEVAALAATGVTFLRGHRWCGELISAQCAFAVAGVISILLIEFEPRKANVDSRVWVIVGDIPPAYIAYDVGDSWQDALSGYIYEMRLWVRAVEAGEPTQELIPVNGAPTLANATALGSRLNFLEENLINADVEDSDC